MSKRELYDDVTDLMTARHRHVNGYFVARGVPALTVADLIELLERFDPAEEVFVLDSCGCCLTGLEELTPQCVGIRDAYIDDIFDGGKSVDELIDKHAENPDAHPLPLPASKWMRRGVVIAGSRWVHYPAVEGEAAERVAGMEGAKHIDDELIARMRVRREWRALDGETFRKWSIGETGPEFDPEAHFDALRKVSGGDEHATP